MAPGTVTLWWGGGGEFGSYQRAASKVPFLSAEGLFLWVFGWFAPKAQAELSAGALGTAGGSRAAGDGGDTSSPRGDTSCLEVQINSQLILALAQLLLPSAFSRRLGCQRDIIYLVSVCGAVTHNCPLCRLGTGGGRCWGANGDFFGAS